MTSKEAIERIKSVLGMASNYSFGSYKIKEGGEFKVEGELEMDKKIYIITEDGEIPSPDGEFELEDGTKVKVEQGAVKKIEQAEEIVEEEKEEEEVEMEEHIEVEVKEEETEEEMAQVSLVDGTIVGNDEQELAVGQELYIITEEGRTIAPDGEHETEDGKIVVVEEGKIIDIKEKEEIQEEIVEVAEEASEISVEEDNFSEVIETFTKAIETLNNEIAQLKEQNNDLKEKFSKFSNEPAGEKVYTSKTLRAEMNAHKMSKLEQLIQLRNNK